MGFVEKRERRLGAKYFLQYLLHPLVRKSFLHLKEAILHMQ